MNDVARALNLTPEQINRINEETVRLQARYRRDFDAIGRLDERERLNRTQELLQTYNTDWRKAANDVFNETQRQRYQQLWLQYEGFNSFNDPDVRRRLNLTDPQREQLREATQWSERRMRELTERGRAEEGQRLYDDYLRERQERLGRILTPEQIQTWRQLTGDAYPFRVQFNTNPR